MKGLILAILFLQVPTGFATQETEPPRDIQDYYQNLYNENQVEPPATPTATPLPGQVPIPVYGRYCRLQVDFIQDYCILITPQPIGSHCRCPGFIGRVYEH